MTLQEATEKFLGKLCNVNWGPLDRLARKNEAIPVDTVNVTVTDIYENCYGEVLFLGETKELRKVTMPFSVDRLQLVD
jgi:hypothetical protein